jgi:uncharacterized protein (UPF0276 family)
VVPIGFTLQPEMSFLELCGRAIRERADYYEIAPETTWRLDGAGALVENGFHRAFAQLGDESGRFFVAHGVGLSLGTAAPADRTRRLRWLERVAEDHRRFAFRWYTDHLGASSLDGRAVTLPLPVPMTALAARVIQRRLQSMQRVVPLVGLENSVSYFLLGAPLDEAGFLSRIVRAPGVHLLLDLHNLHTMAENFGFAPADYLERLDLRRVIEIHLSGGSPSDPAWLASGRVMRLDAHDQAVPEAVWRLFEQVVPRCPNLRGVTLERMEGTVAQSDVATIEAELKRARRVAARRWRA